MTSDGILMNSHVLVFLYHPQINGTINVILFDNMLFLSFSFALELTKKHTKKLSCSPYFGMKVAWFSWISLNLVFASTQNIMSTSYSKPGSWEGRAKCVTCIIYMTMHPFTLVACQLQQFRVVHLQCSHIPLQPSLNPIWFLFIQSH